MNIIVTGASSFIGKAVVRRLFGCGQNVIALRHSVDEAEKEGIVLPETADVFVHFAWAGKGSEGRSDPKIQEYNVEMSMEALRAAERLQCRAFLFAGSQAEYGGAKTDGLEREYGNAVPVSEYGKAKKRFGEMASAYLREKQAKMQFIHMRIFSVYGPGDHEGSLINSLIRHFEKDETMELGACTQLWNYMYIDDLAWAVAKLCGSNIPSGIYNVAGRDTRPLSEYVEAVREIIGKGSPLFGARGNNAEGAADLCPDTARLRILGFREHVSFSEGIARTREALKEENL